MKYRTEYAISAQTIIPQAQQIEIRDIAQELKKQVAQVKFDSTFTTLNELVKKTNSDLKNQVVALQTRYNLYKKQENMGLNPPIEQFSRITHSLLDLIDEFVASQENDTLAQSGIDKTITELEKSIQWLDAWIPQIEKILHNEQSLRGTIWLALIPQLKGTILTLIEVLSLLANLSKISKYIFQDNPINKEENNLPIFMGLDLNYLENLYARMTGFIIITKQTDNQS